MTDKPQKIMLVDESAFILDPDNAEDARRYADLAKFLADANKKNEFDIIVITSDPILLGFVLQDEALSFAIGQIQPWSQFSGADVDTVIYRDPSCLKQVNSARSVRHLDDLQGPDAFRRFYENYEFSLDVGPDRSGFSSAQTALNRASIDDALDHIYGNPDAAWIQSLAEPAVIALVQVFDQASFPADEPPQDQVLARLKQYFELASVAHRIGGMDRDRELASAESNIAGMFGLHNIGGLYNPDSLQTVSPTREHEQLMHNALRSIRRLVDDQLRLRR